MYRPPPLLKAPLLAYNLNKKCIGVGFSGVACAVCPLGVHSLACLVACGCVACALWLVALRVRCLVAYTYN